MTAFTRIVLLLYGIALIVGGIMGYRAGSQQSLIAGGASGVVALLAFFISLKRAKLGFAIGFLVAAAVGYMMYSRYASPEVTAKDMPLRIAIASLVAAVLLLAGLLLGPKRDKA